MRLVQPVSLTVAVATVAADVQKPLEAIGVALAVPADHSTTDSTAWACTLRAWARAPDLTASAVLPGEARLAANGSDCGDIAGWAVGLRMKERAIMKTKSSANKKKFPVRPVWKPSNFTRPEIDFNDIFQTRDYWQVEDEHERAYRMELEAYNKAMAERDLWNVAGVERDVFDVSQDLPWIGPTETTGDVDVVEQFYVHMPATNLPPVEDNRWGGNNQGVDEQLVDHEHLLEYYVSVNLKNGTTLDLPAGQVGVVSLPVEAPVRAQPLVTKLDSPRPFEDETEDDDDFPGQYRRYGPRAPECDKGAQANFEISVTPSPAVAVLGSNVTLDITVKRTGNGTEYPSVLNVYLRSSKQVDWARNKLGEEHYREIMCGSASKRCRDTEYIWTQLLRVKPVHVLEQDRARREQRANMLSTRFSRHRRPLNAVGEARYDFEELELAPADEYAFKLNITVPLVLLPSFNGTFHSFHPKISFELQTKFLCAEELVSAEDTHESGSTPGGKRDAEWVEASLPVRKSKNGKKRSMTSTQWSLQHSGNIDIDIVPELPAVSDGPTALRGLKAYTDPDALGPVLSLSSASVSSSQYKRLGQDIRRETKAELRKARYQREMHCSACGCGQAGRACNVGGANKHAGKMWQAKELAGRVEQERAEGAVEEAVYGEVEFFSGEFYEEFFD